MTKLSTDTIKKLMGSWLSNAESRKYVFEVYISLLLRHFMKKALKISFMI